MAADEQLSGLLRRAVSEYPIDEIGSGLSQHPVRDIIENRIPRKIEEFLENGYLVVKSSVGQGRWTAIPWVAVLDTRETSRIQEGVYVVYLIEPQENRIRLTLNQGVTSVKESEGTASARTQLQSTADEIRREIQPGKFSSGPIEFPHASNRNELYGAGTILYEGYEGADMPPEEVIRGDLESMVRSYQEYVTNRRTAYPTVYQVPIPRPRAQVRENFEKTVLAGVPRSKIDDVIELPIENQDVRVWGNGAEVAADPGDYLLFGDREGRRGGEYSVLARIQHAEVLNDAVAPEFTEVIGWADASDRVFPHVMFLNPIHEVALDRDWFWDVMGFKGWPNDTYSAIDFDRDDSSFFEEYGSIEDFIQEIKAEQIYPMTGNGPSDGYWDMVMTKRRLAHEFLEHPSEDLFNQLVDPDHFWGSMAYQAWSRELFDRHSADKVADLFRLARESGSIQECLELHHVGEGKATEILRALEPTEFAILNKRSRRGMETLGYDLPDRDPSDGAYKAFTRDVLDAYDEFDLREVMTREMEEQIHPDATPLEIADWAFSEHFDGQIDLSELVDGNGPDERYRDYSGRLAVDFDAGPMDPENLYFPEWDQINDRIEQALRGGNNVLLFGPPGTGKTKLARCVCEAMLDSDQFKLVTGSADWSTFDTIGGYRSTKEGPLAFEPGIILERFQQGGRGEPSNEWLIIDELNRADIDKAFGALFSALSDESVTLPYEHENGESIEILDSSQVHRSVAPHRYYIPEDWRMIATMNTLDKTSLYEMSYAFMRRWAFIPVGIPELPDPNSDAGRGDLVELVGEYVEIWSDGGRDEIPDELLGKIGEIWFTVNEYRAIGPAIVEDLYRHTDGIGRDGDPDFVSPIVMYVYPQLEGLRRDELKSVVDGLADLVDDPADLRRTAEDFFQIDLSEGDES